MFLYYSDNFIGFHFAILVLNSQSETDIA